MKKSILITVLATLSLSLPHAWAEEAHDADKDKKSATTMTDKDKQMQMGKMQESMLQMHEQLHKIMDAKNPQERERLMQEHSKMMQDNMSMMQGMKGGCGMMGGEAKGAAMDMHQMMNNPEMRARMQKHMEMMQAMLNSDGNNPEKMQQMMNDPEMKSMMQMHMKCAQMMQGGMMEEQPGTNDMNHDHGNAAD